MLHRDYAKELAERFSLSLEDLREDERDIGKPMGHWTIEDVKRMLEKHQRRLNSLSTSCP